MQDLLRVQRALFQSHSQTRSPTVGDVWLSNTRWSTGFDSALTVMLVVLRTFTEAWSIKPLFDVAPITSDERLASEWSLILDGPVSGLGIPLVIHVDAQSTTSVSMLTEFVGSLSDLARIDLQSLLQAYALEDVVVVKLRVGKRGTIDIRVHPEWSEFSRDVLRVCQVLVAELEVVRSQESAPDASGVSQLAADSLISAEPAPQRVDNWEYRTTVPFVYPRRELPAPMRVGEAIAKYFDEERDTGSRLSRHVSTLDYATYQRIEPFLDIEVTRLFVHNQMRSALYEITGREIQLPDLGILVKVVQRAKMASPSTSGPLAMAARKSDRS